MHALPGVGKNLQDHFLARISCPVTGVRTLNEKSRGLPLMGEVLRYVFTGNGHADLRASLVAASVKVLEEFGHAGRAVPVRAGQLRPGRGGGWRTSPA